MTARQHKVPVVAVSFAAVLGFAALVVGRAPDAGAAAPLPAVIPQPAAETAGTHGAFTLDQGTSITVTTSASDVAGVADYLAGLARPATGLALPISTGTASAQDSLVLDATGPASLGKEGYTLTSTSTSVVVTAGNAEGLSRGVQTLRQLLPEQIESSTNVPGVPWTVPAVSISDSPRYSYRGVMVDVGRHFFTVAQVERVIDQEAMYKMNVLHLGLTNAQGWRIAISAYPTLTSIGGSMPGMSAGYYSAADYKDIVDYAAARYISVVPEIEGPAPAHTTAAVTAMANVLPVDPSNSADNANVRTFLTTVINEVAAETPGQYIHVGGDESSVTGAQYDNWTDAAIAAVRANGKTAIGWAPGIDTDSNVPAGSVYQYWKTTTTTNDKTVADGLAAGSKILMSPTDATYFDYKYTPSDPWGESYATNYPVSKAYNWDPTSVLTALTSGTGDTVSPSAILGVEAELWADPVPVSADASAYADYQLMARLPATAEVGWSALSARHSDSGYDWAGFAARLALQGQRWVRLGYQFYRSPEINWVGLPPLAPVVSDPPRGAQLQLSPATISGTGGAGNTVRVSENSTTLCTATVITDGSWSCTPTRALAAGSRTLTVVQTQPDGQSSPAATVTVSVGATPSLLDHWTMDGVNGKTASDSVTGGYAGTVTGTTTFTPGKVGDAATFDGSASPITTTAPDRSAPWSVGVWVDPTAANSSAGILEGQGGALKVQQYGTTGQVGVTQYGVADSSVDYTAGLNTWTYLTYVDDGTAINVYANGEPVGSIATSLPLGRVTIGSTSRDAAKERLDELSVFGAPLSAGQVAELYHSAQTGGTATVDPNAIPPTISFVTPTANAPLSGTVPVFVKVAGAAIGAYNLRVDSTGVQYYSKPAPGTYVYLWDTTTVSDGKHSLLAAATNAAGVRGTATESINVDNAAKTATAATITLRPTSVGYGSGAKASIVLAAKGRKPAGAVTVYEGSTPVATGVAIKGRAVIVLPTTLTVGAHQLWAAYGGSSTDRATTTSEATLTVSKAPVTVRLAAAARKAGASIPVSVSVTAKPSTLPVPGSVTVTATTASGSTAATATGDLTDGSAALFLPGLSAGTYTLTATYPGAASLQAGSRTRNVTIRGR